MKNAGIVRRSSHSMAGLALAWRIERSFRTHAVISVTVLALLGWRGIALHWWMAAVLVLALGWALELLNAAIETLCDKLHPGRDPAIGAVKDLASASTFVVNLAAAAVCLLALVAA